MNKIKVGIFFGGSSREREISFAGGRTVFDNLDKSIFEAIPQIMLEDLQELIDVAFLALHGSGGEDGQLQGVLEFLKIPYTGSGIFPSAIGINKSIQKQWMKVVGYDVPNSFVLTKGDWENQQACLTKASNEIGFPLVVRPANQGSSIGVSIVKEADLQTFAEAINLGFFEYRLTKQEWNAASDEKKVKIIGRIGDIKEGLGFPMYADGMLIYHPDDLYDKVKDVLFVYDEIILKGEQSENEVLLESFIDGREFSCIVMRKEDGTCAALPPTEIVEN